MPASDTHDELRDRAWQAMVAAVFEGRDDWRRAVSEATGMPFTRIRVLRRVERAPRSLSELARETGMDAPATSVTVNDLEERGYVTRESAPHDRRIKHVTITDAGRAALARAREVTDPAPPALDHASDEQLRVVVEMLSPREARAPETSR